MYIDISTVDSNKLKYGGLLKEIWELIQGGFRALYGSRLPEVGIWASAD